MNLTDIWPIIAFLAVQTVAITWWAATVTARIAVLNENSSTSRNNGERLAKIETSIENIERAVAGIEQLLPNLPKRNRS